MNACRFCGCTESQARADARVLGLRDEFERGQYSCCQLVAWADEQWVAWTDAAREDGKPQEIVTKPLEITAAGPELVPVPLGKKRPAGSRRQP